MIEVGILSESSTGYNHADTLAFLALCFDLLSDNYRHQCDLVEIAEIRLSELTVPAGETTIKKEYVSLKSEEIKELSYSMIEKLARYKELDKQTI